MSGADYEYQQAQPNVYLRQNCYISKERNQISLHTVPGEAMKYMFNGVTGRDNWEGQVR